MTLVVSVNSCQVFWRHSESSLHLSARLQCCRTCLRGLPIIHSIPMTRMSIQVRIATGNVCTHTHTVTVVLHVCTIGVYSCGCVCWRGEEAHCQKTGSAIFPTKGAVTHTERGKLNCIIRLMYDWRVRSHMWAVGSGHEWCWCCYQWLPLEAFKREQHLSDWRTDCLSFSHNWITLVNILLITNSFSQLTATISIKSSNR